MATLRDIRQRIGLRVPGQQPQAMHPYVLTANSPSPDQLVVATLSGETNSHSGKYVVVNEPGTTRTPRDLTREVRTFDADTSTLTLYGNLPYTPQAGTGIELWDSRYPPFAIESYINQAIENANQRTYQTSSVDTILVGPLGREFVVPRGMQYVSAVQIQRSVEYAEIAGEFSAWPASTQADYYTLGIHVRQLPAATDIALDVPESLERGRWTHVAALVYNHDSASALAIEIPGAAGFEFGRVLVDVQGRGWHYAVAPLEGSGAIDRLVLNVGNLPNSNDPFPLSVWRVRVVNEDSAQWQDVEFTLPQGTGQVNLPYAYESEPQRYRILGGADYELLESDLDEAPVSAEFLMAHAIAEALASEGAENPDSALANLWIRRSRAAFGNLPNPKRHTVLR